MAEPRERYCNRIHQFTNPLEHFIMAMNLIITAATREIRGTKMQSGIYYVPVNGRFKDRGFMDDLTVTTKTPIQTRWV